MMEVYSIINDLDQIDTTSHTRMLQQAFIRNKHLLKKYTTKFRNTTPIQFRAQIRLVLKQVKSTPNLEYVGMDRHTSREFCGRYGASKRNTQVLSPLKLDALEQIPTFCRNTARFSVFRGIENMEKTSRRQTEKIQPRLSKRLSGQVQGCKIKNISLGNNIEQYEQKIQNFLNNRYKTTLTRLKILYNSNNNGNGKSGSNFPLRPLYFINHSLAEYISKNLTRH